MTAREVTHEEAQATRQVGLTTISHGGGVQTTAMTVLWAQGRIDADVALFANVGDDSENPKTIRYVREVLAPFCEAHRLPFHELHKLDRAGGQLTLYGQLTRDGSRSLPIPVRMADTGAPGTRSCTHEFKIKVIRRWLREHGATEAAPADVLIGFSTDEVERMGRRRTEPTERPVYPLIDLGLDRAACAQIIRDAGLPVPPKSACWFCPFHNRRAWAEQRRDEPDLFAKSVELERTLNARRDVLGKDHVYLTRYGRPLDEAIAQAQDTLPGLEPDGFETCDEGACWT